jgi:hypothetical protein
VIYTNLTSPPLHLCGDWIVDLFKVLLTNTKLRVSAWDYGAWWPSAAGGVGCFLQVAERLGDGFPGEVGSS